MKQNLYQRTKSSRWIALAGLVALSLGCSHDSSPKRSTTTNISEIEDLTPALKREGIKLESVALASYRIAENSRDSVSIHKALADLEKARLYLEDGPRWCAATYRMGKLNFWLNKRELTDQYISQLKQSDEPACKQLALVLQHESSKQRE